MKPLRALLLCAALLVGGCDESVELGHPPPVLVQTDQRAVAVRGGAGRDRLERAIAAIAAGNREAVHAVIRSRSPGAAAATRRLLVSLGLDPVRIVEAPDRGRGAEVVLTRAFALTARGGPFRHEAAGVVAERAVLQRRADQHGPGHHHDALA